MEQGRGQGQRLPARDEEQAAVDNWQLSAHGTHFQGPKQDLGGSYSPNPLPRTGLKLTLKAMAMSQR